MLCQALASGPADPQENLLAVFHRSYSVGNKRVWITTPYFIPDEAVFAALRLAVLRGVDVRVLIPARPDHKSSTRHQAFFAFEAVRAGVRMFRYQPGFCTRRCTGG